MTFVPPTGPRRLRELLKDPKSIVVCPGVFDGLTARLALNSGFEALYMTGAGTSMSKLGWADMGIAKLSDMRGNAEMIASLNPAVPLIADADTGYGGPIMVARTVKEYSRAGVAALHIEDQVQEKRCGHLLGKQLVEREEYYSRLRAAVTARNAIQSEMLIIARTDARQTFGFDEAYERLKEAVAIGVDVVFLEAPTSKEECKKICELMKGVPVLFNSVPGGASPSLSVEEAKELGFRIIIHPGLCIGPMIKAVNSELEHLKTNGRPSLGAEQAGSVKMAFNICGLQECIAIDAAAGGQAYGSIGK